MLCVDLHWGFRHSDIFRGQISFEEIQPGVQLQLGRVVRQHDSADFQVHTQNDPHPPAPGDVPAIARELVIISLHAWVALCGGFLCLACRRQCRRGRRPGHPEVWQRAYEAEHRHFVPDACAFRQYSPAARARHPWDWLSAQSGPCTGRFSRPSPAATCFFAVTLTGKDSRPIPHPTHPDARPCARALCFILPPPFPLLFITPSNNSFHRCSRCSVTFPIVSVHTGSVSSVSVCDTQFVLLWHDSNSFKFSRIPTRVF